MAVLSNWQKVCESIIFPCWLPWVAFGPDSKLLFEFLSASRRYFGYLGHVSRLSVLGARARLGTGLARSRREDARPLIRREKVQTYFYDPTCSLDSDPIRYYADGPMSAGGGESTINVFRLNELSRGRRYHYCVWLSHCEQVNKFIEFSPKFCETGRKLRCSWSALRIPTCSHWFRGPISGRFARVLFTWSYVRTPACMT